MYQALFFFPLEPKKQKKKKKKKTPDLRLPAAKSEEKRLFSQARKQGNEEPFSFSGKRPAG